MLFSKLNFQPLEPQFVMLKRNASTRRWQMAHTIRLSFGPGAALDITRNIKRQLTALQLSARTRRGYALSCSPLTEQGELKRNAPYTHTSIERYENGALSFKTEKVVMQSLSSNRAVMLNGCECSGRNNQMGDRNRNISGLRCNVPRRVSARCRDL